MKLSSESPGGYDRLRGAVSDVRLAALSVVLVATLVVAAPGGAHALQPPVPGADQPVEVTHVSSCLAGNGRVDTNIVNTGGSSARYRVEVSGLTARESTVARGDWWRFPVTGRPDGALVIVVRRNGLVVSAVTVTVACDRATPVLAGPELQVVNACRADRGYLLFQFVNATSGSRPYVIAFEGLANRSTTAQPFGQSVRGVTGRPDGTYQVTVTSRGEVVDAFAVVVACGDGFADSEPPGRPGGVIVRADQLTATSAGLRWNPSTDNVGVVLYRLFLNGAQVAALGPSARGYIFEGLEPSTTYTVGVAAVDGAGNQSLIGTAGVTTPRLSGDTGEGDVVTDVIVTSDLLFAPIGPWNGITVYLSSPRHTNSGDRGECGWEENINGRHFNAHAANGVYWDGEVREPGDPGFDFRNLRRRGYRVIVGSNPRDDGLNNNVARSNAAGADVHIVTHTNALSGCGNQTGNYTLSMWREGSPETGRQLAEIMATTLDAVVPGTGRADPDRPIVGFSLGELRSPAAPTRVFNEIMFHDNQTHVDWFQGGGGVGDGVREGAWRYGFALDSFFTNPAANYGPLSAVPGFGVTEVDRQRDDVIAVWESYRRQTAVEACMARAGFDLPPEPEHAMTTLVAVARSLDVLGWTAASADGSEVAAARSAPQTNRTLRAELSSEDRNRFDLALWGHDTATVDAYGGAGGAAASVALGIAGGCWGDAEAVSGGVWELRRELLPQLWERLGQIADDRSSNLRTRFDACVAGFEMATGETPTSPSDLERLMDNGSVVAAEAISRCSPVWTVEYAAARADVETQLLAGADGDRLAEQRSRYRTAVRDAAADAGFGAFLRSVLSGSAR